MPYLIYPAGEGRTGGERPTRLGSKHAESTSHHTIGPQKSNLVDLGCVLVCSPRRATYKNSTTYRNSARNNTGSLRPSSLPPRTRHDKHNQPLPHKAFVVSLLLPLPQCPANSCLSAGMGRPSPSLLFTHASPVYISIPFSRLKAQNRHKPHTKNRRTGLLATQGNNQDGTQKPTHRINSNQIKSMLTCDRRPLLPTAHARLQP